MKNICRKELLNRLNLCYIHCAIDHKNNVISETYLPTCVLVTQPCLTLCDPMDCSPLGSSVHGILQAGILEWVAIPYSRGSSQPRDQTQSLALQAVSLPLSYQGSPYSGKIFMALLQDNILRRVYILISTKIKIIFKKVFC